MYAHYNKLWNILSSRNVCFMAVFGKLKKENKNTGKQCCVLKTVQYEMSSYTVL